MSKRKLMLIIAAFTVVGCLVGVFSMRQAAQDRPLAQKDDATPIQEGVMTESQREHSRLYKGMGRRKISDLIAKYGDNAFVKDFSPERNSMPGGKTDDLLVASARWGACNSDAVLVGFVTSKTSQLTEDGYYIFTDYTIRPTTYVKGEDTNVDKSGTIILSEPGGKIRLNGRLIQVLNGEHPTLEVGKKYLFILSKIPKTNDFRLTPDARAEEYRAEENGNVVSDLAANPSSDDSGAAAQARRIQLISAEPCTNGRGNVK